MRRMALVLLALVLTAGAARATDETSFLEAQLAAWQEGDIPRRERPPEAVRRLIRYEIISTVVARINDRDVSLANAFCTFEPERRRNENDADAAEEFTRRVVFRVEADAHAADGFRLSASWRELGVAPLPDLGPAPPAPTPTPLTSAQRAEAVKLATQLRNTKLNLREREEVRSRLVDLGPAVVEVVLRELRTGDMEHRREVVEIARRLHPADESQILRDELAYAVGACGRLVARIQSDADQAQAYRDKAAKIKVPTGGSYGGLKFRPEATERESYLRLADRSDELVADSRRELDACARVVEICCEHLAQRGTPQDLAFLASLVADKSAPLKPTAWSLGVIGNNEYRQAPPVGFSTRYSVSVRGQEQDWLPWGPAWGALRTLAARVDNIEALAALQVQMEKAFAPMEKKRAATWQQACLMTEFHRAEGLVLDRLASADDLRWKALAALEYAGEAKAKYLAALGPAPEKPGDDEWDKRRKLSRHKALQREMEMTQWRVTMRPSASVASGPSFAMGAFDFYKETLPVVAFLEGKPGAEADADRIALGAFDLPMRVDVAQQVTSLKRPVRLEFVGRLRVFASLSGPIASQKGAFACQKVDSVCLVDDKTGEVISRFVPAP